MREIAIPFERTDCPDCKKLIEELKQKQCDKVIYIKNKDAYLYGMEGFIKTARIEEIDINRPWTISEYDGAEGIQYLNFKVIDETINYCKLK